MIAIIGGGIAGLSAAYELTVRRVPFRLFEASSRLGGLIHTERVGGFTIEAGADSMLAQKRAGLELCAELGLEPRIIPTRTPRTSFVLHHGRLHALPSPSMLGIPTTWKGLLAYDLLSPAARARIALEPLIPRAPRAAESIGDFFRRRFGHETANLVAQPLLGAIYAGDVNRLSLRMLVPRLADAESGGSVLGWMRRGIAAGDTAGAFRSLSSGMGELVDAIRRRLPADAVSLDSPALALEPGWRVHARAGAIDCAGVIIAAPAHTAATLLSPVDAEAASLCAATQYVSTAAVALAWPRAAVRHPLHGTGFVVVRPSNAVRVTACTWASSKFEGRAPVGSVLLRAFFGGADDAGAVDLTDEHLVGTAVGDLAAILSIDGPPTLARVYKWRDAGAQHDTTQPARMARLSERLADHRGLFVTGSGFRSVGVPDCIADGRATAAAAASFASL